MKTKKNLKALETNELIDMLVQKTEILTSKIAEKNSVELQQYEYEIALIQSELMSRNHPATKTSISDKDSKFNSGTN